MSQPILTATSVKVFCSVKFQRLRQFISEFLGLGPNLGSFLLFIPSVICFFLPFSCSETLKYPGDFVINVKQINSQSDLISISSFAGPVLPHNQILCLHHFNLRHLYFRSLQSLPNWVQLHTSENSTVCTSFQ